MSKKKQTRILRDVIVIKELINNLYKAYDQLNQQLFNSELPDIMITIQSNEKLPKNKKLITGFCTNVPMWQIDKGGKTEYKYEMTLIAEYLNRGYEDTIETELHEMVHLSNIANHIDDCSKRGKHNEKFKNKAESIGMYVEIGEKVGYGVTSLGDHLKEIVHNLEVDKEVFKCFRIVIPPKEHKVKNVTPKFKYKCSCGKEFTSKSDDMIVICKDCNTEFEKLN